MGSRKWNDLPCRLNQPYTCQIRYFTWKKQQKTNNTKTKDQKTNNVKEPLSLYFSAAAADNTSSAKSNITRRRNNRKQTTLKRNNRKNKQHKTKESLHLSIWATFYVPNLLLFIERESRDNREREKKNNHLQHLITNETEMNKCNRNYPYT